MALLALGGHSPKLPGGFYFVAENASVIGDIELSDDVSIWFGAVLRGENEPIVVGHGSNIQDLCVLHTDVGFPLTIGPGCTIGHRVTLHGCTVGENSLIGMGATVLNGARIGNNCLIGASTLITEGKEIPDNSLAMGTPGRVVRALGSDEVLSLRRSAEHYIANARRFATGLSPA